MHAVGRPLAISNRSSEHKRAWLCTVYLFNIFNGPISYTNVVNIKSNVIIQNVKWANIPFNNFYLTNILFDNVQLVNTKYPVHESSMYKFE